MDEVTGGGLPKGRVTLLCGSAGCGKSLLAMEFLVHGAVRYGEPGVCMDFEETEEKLAANVASLGFDLRELTKRKKLLVDYVSIERDRIAETGEYNLEGLFIRLGHAVKAIKAKRVVLDSIEALFSGLVDSTILRAELRRLFHWLEEHKLTAVVTGEAGEHTLTRHGLEEYIADCVIGLDHRVTEQISTRRLRIVKYRGTSHGTDEYPFLIDREGISVVPLTSLALAHENDPLTSGALADIAGIADQALQEMRTTSYLLHPPLLDEAGLTSAARWYVEGFSQRSGIQVNLDSPSGFERLPNDVEMVLFRVLQESLTNVHRHSGASIVDIEIQRSPEEVTMKVQDNGHGIAPELLDRLRKTTSDSGVGLAGMRERLSELNGLFEVKSVSNGTTLRVGLPLAFAEKSKHSAHVEDSNRSFSMRMSSQSVNAVANPKRSG